MQSGVAAKMSFDSKEVDPKHLRVGINTAMSDHCALVRLLIAKGVITDAEYREAITQTMNEEYQRYQDELTTTLGKPVKLG